MGGFYGRCTVTNMVGRRSIAQSGPIGKVKTGNVETRIESDPYLCIEIQTQLIVPLKHFF